MKQPTQRILWVPLVQVHRLVCSNSNNKINKVTVSEWITKSQKKYWFSFCLFLRSFHFLLLLIWFYLLLSKVDNIQLKRCYSILRNYISTDIIFFVFFLTCLHFDHIKKPLSLYCLVYTSLFSFSSHDNFSSLKNHMCWIWFVFFPYFFCEKFRPFHHSSFL